MADFARYYKRFFLHWGNEVLSFGREQMVGVILAILILFFQMEKGLIPARDAALTAKATIFWPYLVLIGIYFVIHLVRTPWKLDQELRAELKIQSSEKDAKARIEVLTRLADRGQDIMRRCRGEKDLVPIEEVQLWSEDVSESVSAIFDETYVSRLGSNIGIPLHAAYWPNLENRHVDSFAYVRVYRLQQFIDELRARSKAIQQ